MIYAIRNKRTRSVKLGYSGEPKMRIKGLQTANEDELILEAFVHGSKQQEEHFHDVLAHERIRGEWFRGPHTDAIVLLLMVIGAQSEFKDQLDTAHTLSRLLSAPAEKRRAFVEFAKGIDWGTPLDFDELGAEIDGIMGWDDELSF